MIIELLLLATLNFSTTVPPECDPELGCIDIEVPDCTDSRDCPIINPGE